MSNFTAFILGFLSASVICFAAAFSYYLRARSRVRAIESAIKRYQDAKVVVGDAVNQAYGGKP